MRERNKLSLALIVVSTMIITYLHYSILGEQSPYIVLEELYYIPILLGALIFGLKGALLTYLFVSGCYLPYFFGGWATTVLSFLDRLLHLLFSGVFAFLAGFMVEWDRRREKRFEKDRYLAGLGEAATAIVHDLRNPILSIQGFARRIREGKGNIAAAAETIENSARNMQQMVEGVLDFARPVRLELKEEDILGVVRRACESCQVRAEEKGILLDVELPASPLQVKIDGFNLQRAVANLISNAIDASAKGQRVVILVECMGGHATVRVRDFGSGMDKETLENIFIPFYSKKSSGTGLGMAIVKKTIEAHRGKIHIDSHEGRGTEVRMELPVS